MFDALQSQVFLLPVNMPGNQLAYPSGRFSAGADFGFIWSVLIPRKPDYFQFACYTATRTKLAHRLGLYFLFIPRARPSWLAFQL